MTSGYMLLSLCLVLTQIPGFLTKPSDFDGYGDEQEWSGETRRGMNSYDSLKTMLFGFDDNDRAVERQSKGSWTITPMTPPLNAPEVPPRIPRRIQCNKCGLRFWNKKQLMAHMKRHRKIQRAGKWGLKTAQDQIPNQPGQGYNEMDLSALIEPQCDPTLTEDIRAIIVDTLNNYRNPSPQDYIS